MTCRFPRRCRLTLEAHAPLISAALAALMLVPASGCRAAVAVLPLHLPVAPVPSLNPGAPELWVALAAHLRPGADSAPLELTAAAGVLELSDAGGQRFSGQRLTLAWRSLPLAEPITLRRRVLGPFASYESAQRMAELWRRQGARPLIAQPRDWEVWADGEAADPPGHASRLQEQVVGQRLVLELRRDRQSIPLQGPLELQAPGGLLWRGGRYGGPFRLQSDAHGGWTLVERVPLDRYLEGVLPHEIGAAAPAAALEAQAVLARTWAVSNRQRFAVDGYHLCADTQCQVYSHPQQAGPAVRGAIQRTARQVLAWQGQPIHAVYHASNGGIAAGFEEAWQGEPLPYLRAAPDGPAPFAKRFALPLQQPQRLAELLNAGQAAYGSDHPRFRWQRLLSADQVRTALAPLAPSLGIPQRLEVLERGVSGRVLALRVEGSGGSTVLRLDAIRRYLRQLPSTLFELSPLAPGRWQVRGGGFGHGAGLSQAGAIDLARRGWSSRQILEHYYPGVSMEPLTALGSLKQDP
ncbi:MAG: SpoIID/LytB domain-containing protein [Prochlorococcaceae cyanobacterium]